jgi:hypothetical protein
VISPTVLHNEVKCEVLEGLAQLLRTPLLRKSGEKGGSRENRHRGTRFHVLDGGRGLLRYKFRDGASKNIRNERAREDGEDGAVD